VGSTSDLEPDSGRGLRLRNKTRAAHPRFEFNTRRREDGRRGGARARPTAGLPDRPTCASPSWTASPTTSTLRRSFKVGGSPRPPKRRRKSAPSPCCSSPCSRSTVVTPEDFWARSSATSTAGVRHVKPGGSAAGNAPGVSANRAAGRDVGYATDLRSTTQGPARRTP